MKRTKMGQFACWTTLIVVGVAFSTVDSPVWGAEGPAPVKKMLGRKGRRLPARYASVVDEKQREEIYKIQEEYQPKIAALEKQLKALKTERDKKISAVLTPEQKKQVEEAAAKTKNAPKDAKPAKEETPLPPVEPKPAKIVEPKPAKIVEPKPAK
jgi:hypothetical protein